MGRSLPLGLLGPSDLSVLPRRMDPSVLRDPSGLLGPRAPLGLLGRSDLPVLPRRMDRSARQDPLLR